MQRNFISLLLLAVILLLSQTTLCVASRFEEANGNSFSNLGDFAHSVSQSMPAYLLKTGSQRPTFTAGNVPARFCAYSEQNGCNYRAYLESLGFLIIPGVIVGLVLTVGLVIFVIGYCVKKTWRPRFNYKRTEIRNLKLVIIFTSLILLALAIATFIGTSKIMKGTREFGDDMVAFGQKISDLVTQVNTTLNSIQFTAGVDVSTERNSADGLVLNSKIIRGVVETYERPISNVFLAASVILAFIALLAIISCFIWLAISGHINFFFGLGLILLFWIIFGLGLGVGNGLTDLCKEFDAGTGNTTNPVVKEFIGIFGGNCSSFGDVTTNTNNAIASFKDIFCVTYNNSCTATPPMLINCIQCDNTTLFSDLKAQTNVNDDLFCPDARCTSACPLPLTTPCKRTVRTIDDCAINCESSAAKNMSQYIQTLVNDEKTISDLFVTIEPYAGCKIAQRFIEFCSPALCEVGMSGIIIDLICSAIIGFFLIIFNITMIFSISRLNPNKVHVEGQGNEVHTGKGVLSNTIKGTIGFYPSKKFSYDEDGGSVTTHEIDQEYELDEEEEEQAPRGNGEHTGGHRKPLPNFD